MMNSFEEHFSRTLPEWISNIKEEAKAKITGAPFASACREGNLTAMRGLIVGLWPFIDIFPKSLIRGASRLPKVDGLEGRQLLNTLLHRGPQILSSIRNDEENHRRLWIKSGEALELSFPADFKRPVLPEVQAWIDAIESESDSFTSIVRFAAVEIIAETVSLEFLASDAFVSALGNRGCEWFRVHAQHGPGMSHEELELKLAFSLLKEPPDKERTNTIIQHVVDLSVAAENASAQLVVEIPAKRPRT